MMNVCKWEEVTLSDYFEDVFYNKVTNNKTF